MTRRVLPVLLALLAVVVWQAPARAAGHTVTLATSGPSPSALTISAGDTVTFKAADANTYHLRRTGGSWTVPATVTQSKPFTTEPFTQPGTYSYTMSFDTLIGPSPPQSGSIVVPATAPSPSPTAAPSASASARPTTSARPSASASPTAVPTASGVALPPPIVGGVVPSATPSASAGPMPQVAPPVAAGSPEPSATTAVSYAPKAGIVQRSAHGIGLPAVLAAVGVVGVVSLLVRFLLAAPEARPDIG